MNAKKAFVIFKPNKIVIEEHFPNLKKYIYITYTYIFLCICVCIHLSTHHM